MRCCEGFGGFGGRSVIPAVLEVNQRGVDFVVCIDTLLEFDTQGFNDGKLCLLVAARVREDGGGHVGEGKLCCLASDVKGDGHVGGGDVWSCSLWRMSEMRSRLPEGVRADYGVDC